MCPLPLRMSRHAAPCHNQGFTLIELLVALGIVGLLALSAYPSYRDTRLKARRAEAASALLRAMQQQERYYSQHNRYAAYDGAAWADANDFLWFSGNHAQSSAYQISAAACAGQRLEQCIRLSASPGTALVDQRFSDPICGVFTLDSRGEQSASGQPLTVAPDVCR